MGMKKSFLILSVLIGIIAVGFISSSSTYFTKQVSYDTGDLCMDGPGYNSTTKLSDYVIEFIGGIATHYNDSDGLCGEDGYYTIFPIGMDLRGIILNTPYLPFTGDYIFNLTIKNQDNLNEREDFNVTCGGVTTIVEEPKKETEDLHSGTLIHCPSYADYNFTIDLLVCGKDCWNAFSPPNRSKVITFPDNSSRYFVEGIVHRNSGPDEPNEDIYLELNGETGPSTKDTNDWDYNYTLEYLGEFEFNQGDNEVIVRHPYTCDPPCDTTNLSSCTSNSVELMEICLYEIDDGWKNVSIPCKFEKGNNNITLIPSNSSSGSVHFDLFRIYSNNHDFKIGSCEFNSSVLQECQQGILEYGLITNWTWGAYNHYSNLSQGPTSNSSDYVEESSGNWYFDPEKKSIKCVGGSITMPCPQEIPLSFFNFINLIFVVIIVFVIYIFFSY